MKVKCYVSGNVRQVSGRDGREHTFSEVFVYLPGEPMARPLNVYGALPVGRGMYEAQLKISIRNERLQADLDFSQAKPVSE
ncbi:MAG: hypothetical protein QXT77_09825 [Candidatus Methanomethylicaceae archaeon]